MKLVLIRKPSSNGTTIGELFLENGEFLCYTLEDQIRDLTKVPKVYAQTAIMPGTYKVIINMSNRFKKLLPLLLNVAQFEGIRIHSGNTKADTEGCILVGTKVSADRQSVLNSRVAFTKVFTLMQMAIDKGHTVSIEINNPKG